MADAGRGRGETGTAPEGESEAQPGATAMAALPPPHPAVAPPPPPNEPPVITPLPPSPPTVGGESTSPGRGDSDDGIARAKELMRQITASRGTPDAKLFHNLAYILEVEESKYQQLMGQPFMEGRSAYAIGRLVSLVRDDDEFYEFISSTILLEPTHPVGRKAAATRLLLACLSCSMPWLQMPSLVDDAVLSKLKEWASEEITELLPGGEWGGAAAGEGSSGRRRPTRDKEEHGRRRQVREEVSRCGRWQQDMLEKEMLRTYATGLLAVLTQSEDVVDDVVRTGMVGSLMRFLRAHVLRDEGGGKERVRAAPACTALEGATNQVLAHREQREREREVMIPAELRARGRLSNDVMQPEEGRATREDGTRVREDMRSRVRTHLDTSQRDEARALELPERDRLLERPQREVPGELKTEILSREGKEVIVGEPGPVDDSMETWNGREIPEYDGDDEDDRDGWLEARERGKDARDSRDKGRVSLLKDLNRVTHVGEIRRLRDDDESMERPCSSRSLRVVEARDRSVLPGSRSPWWIGPTGRERAVSGEEREHAEVTGTSGDGEVNFRAGRTGCVEGVCVREMTEASAGPAEFGTGVEAVGGSKARDTEMKDVEGTGGGGEEGCIGVCAVDSGKKELREGSKDECNGAEDTQMEAEEEKGDVAHEGGEETKVGEAKNYRDISDIITRAAKAAEAEARTSGASGEAVMTVMEIARETARQAYVEAKAAGKTDEEAFGAAEAVATAISNAAESATVTRKRVIAEDISARELAEASLLKADGEADVDQGMREWAVDAPKLLALKERFCVQCLAAMGEYLEVLGPVLHEKGLDVCLALLKRKPKDPNKVEEVSTVSDVLKLVCALAAHRKFAQLFVDRGGVQLLLAVPRVPYTFTGISLCLFALASIQGVMERVCALPAAVISEVVSLALSLLSCAYDPARKNAALFFGASFVFRAIVDAFDSQDGLRRVLNLLRAALALRATGGPASVLNGIGNVHMGAGPHGSLLGSIGVGSLGIQGGGSSGSLPFAGGSGVSTGPLARGPEMLTASGKQIAFHTCVAIRQYFRTQLVLLVDSIKQSISTKGHKGDRGSLGPRSGAGRAAYKAVDISNEVIDGIITQLQRDRRLGPAFVRANWPSLQKFMDCGGHVLMLELTQLHLQAGPRYFHEIAQYALGVLHITTLMPATHRAVLGVDGSMISNDKNGMAVILDAASGASQQANADPEIIHVALLVLINLVCPPPSLCSRGGQGPGASLPAANAMVAANGSIPMNLPSATNATNGPLFVSNGSGAAVGGVQGMPLAPGAGTAVAASGQGAFGEPLSREKAVAALTAVVDREKLLVDRSVVLGSAIGSGLMSGTGQGLVGDRRISLGPGAGGSGMAAYMEQQYRCAREAVRANNGIKVLLMLLNQRLNSLPATLDCIRALACRVLLGLSRDQAIAHILTKLQVGRMLTELTKDSRGTWGRQSGGGGGEQNKWPQEFNRVALELIAITTDKPSAGRVTTATASEAAAPTLRKIEKAAIAAATPISYNARELLQLIHEHLVASGLPKAASLLLEESGILPMPVLCLQVSGPACPMSGYLQGMQPTSLAHPFISSGAVTRQSIPWPVGRVQRGFMMGLAEVLRDGERDTGAAGALQGRGGYGSHASHGLSKGKRSLCSRVCIRTACGGTSIVKKLTLQGTGADPSGNEGNTNGDKEGGECGGGGACVSAAAESCGRHVSFSRLLPSKRRADSPLSPSRGGPPPPQWTGGGSTGTTTMQASAAQRPEQHGCTSAAAAAAAAAAAPAVLLCNGSFAAGGPSSASSHLHSTPPTGKHHTPNPGRVEQCNTHLNQTQRIFSSPLLVHQHGAFWHLPATARGALDLAVDDGATCGGGGAGSTVRGGSTLDAIVTQYLKHQHRQCPSPITTLPPLSLLYPHVCPEPRRLMDAPYNISRRVQARQRTAPYGGSYGKKHDRHFVFSRFRPWRTCRDEAAQLTTVTFLGRSKLAVGSRMGDVRLFDSTTGALLETHSFHETGVMLLQSAPKGGWGWGWGGGIVEAYEDSDLGPRMLVLSSSKSEVKLWDPSAMESGPLHKFEDCRNGRFNPSATRIVAVDNNHRQVKIFDVQTGKEEQVLREGPLVPGLGGDRGSYGRYANAYFSPADNLTLCCGVLWDYRIPRAVHKFDQFTDYGGGAFHPGGNEVIINSEVWDLRTFKLLKSVPALDGTAITFNSTGEVIYAILRRYTDGFGEVFHPRRAKNPLFAAFRTMDASDYSDISMVSVDRCVWDLAVEPTDSHIAVVMMDELKEMDAFARLYEVGRRRPTEGDSDPDDGADTEDEDESEGDEEEDDEDGLHPGMGIDLGSNEDGSGEEGERLEGEGMFSEERSDEDEEDEDTLSEDERGDPASLLRLLSEADDDDRDGSEFGTDTASDYSSSEEFGEDGFDNMLQGLL